MATEEISIRLAQEADFLALEDMERKIWGPLGTDVYDEVYFRAWMNTSPDGFYVAEEHGIPVGFTYVQTIALQELKLPHGTTYNDLTDNGYTTRSHRPNGNYRFGLTVCSLSPGAGWRLMQATINDGKKRNKPILGVSRLADFTAWIEQLRANGHIGGTLSDDVEASLALHYTLECVRLHGGRTLPGLYASYDPTRWPPLTKPDSVLKKYLRQQEFCLVQVVPKFWHDAGSRGFTVLFGAV